MFGHLPDHISQLNSISSPPPTTLNPESEEAFWEFMHTDELFDNFAAPPQSPIAPVKAERKSLNLDTPVLAPALAPTAADTPAAQAGTAAAPSGTVTPTIAQAQANTPAQTLESFLAAFANEPPVTAAAAASNYRMAVPLPLPYNALASSSASAGVNHIDTAAIQPYQPVMPYTAASTPAAEERPTGAKRLKQLGAGALEIEEDKRRRNTEASARFRAKKKEREQAIEHRAKALEAQVAQLTAEKASLENENKLLKAIVLGGQGLTGGSEAVSSALAQLGDKRLRD